MLDQRICVCIISTDFAKLFFVEVLSSYILTINVWKCLFLTVSPILYAIKLFDLYLTDN